MRSYLVKENPIGSAVSEILCYKQTDRQTDKQTDKQTHNRHTTDTHTQKQRCNHPKMCSRARQTIFHATRTRQRQHLSHTHTHTPPPLVLQSSFTTSSRSRVRTHNNTLSLTIPRHYASSVASLEFYETPLGAVFVAFVWRGRLLSRTTAHLRMIAPLLLCVCC